LSTCISKAYTGYRFRPAFTPEPSMLWQSTGATMIDQGTVVLSAL